MKKNLLDFQAVRRSSYHYDVSKEFFFEYESNLVLIDYIRIGINILTLHVTQRCCQLPAQLKGNICLLTVA